jgi:poly(A) polymerase
MAAGPAQRVEPRSAAPLTTAPLLAGPPQGGRGTRPARSQRGDTPRILAAAELGIREAAIHPHVIHICQTLQRHGHQALVVGGAVRDLILGRHPKDFDIVTSARPEQVKQLFRNARIIGRRFRLCLLRFGEMKVEVSTFRGLPRRGADGMIRRDNTYGTPREDAFRRDFTCNALAMDPLARTIVDHVGGLADLQAGRIRTITPPTVSFTEDPVRMLRAIRFQLRLGFTLDSELADTITRQADGLRQVTRHRLADEAQRFLTAGMALATYTEFDRRGLLRPLLGLEDYGWFFSPEAIADPLSALREYLQCMDRWSKEGPEPLPPTVVLLGVLITLARPEFRAYLTTGPTGKTAAPGRAAVRLDARIVRRFKRELPPMLLTWGLLRGQVEPALRILGAVRLLLKRGEEGSGARVRRKRPPQIGEREAWLLLGIVGSLLGANPSQVEAGLARLHELPDLPILDHPRPVRRAPSKTERPIPEQETSAPRASSARKRKRRRRNGGARRPTP